MTQLDLSEKKVLLVGASGGLGRGVARCLAERGARVALAARRKDAIAEAARAIGANAIGLQCDVRDPDSCTETVAAAVEQFDGLNALVYCSAIGVLRPIANCDAELWADVFATNVTGAALMTAAALPHLTAAKGRAVFVSSISASQTAPWPGLGSYVVSKAALDKLVQSFTVEHPEVLFTRISMGESAGGDGAEASAFFTGWDPDMFAEYMNIWVARGYMDGRVISIDELADVVSFALSTGAHLPVLQVRPGIGESRL